MPRASGAVLRDEHYASLAGFRQALRRFLAFSETAARAAGIGPRQYQALLAIRAAADGRLAIGELAAELGLRHHSTVELVKRMEAQGLLARRYGREDRRRVYVHLSRHGALVLGKLAALHRRQLAQLRPQLEALLASLPGR
jgi:DNA-binding MarR family transcriptional regulator